MMESAESEYINVTDYLFNLDIKSEHRYEYYRGKVSPMRSTSDRHNIISLNIAFALRSRLQGTTSQVFMQNVRLEVQEGQHYAYPDIMVTCDTRDRQDHFTKRYPLLIVEVLSDATEGYDRGKKSSQYRKIPTLQELVLVSQSECAIAKYSRSPTGWLLTELFSTESQLNLLSSLNLEIPLGEIYAE